MTGNKNTKNEVNMSYWRSRHTKCAVY